MNKTPQIIAYTLDLSKTDRNGAFKCPHCKAKISPDDHSEAIYSIYDTVVTNNNLAELVLHCKRCLSFINLTGFCKISATH